MFLEGRKGRQGRRGRRHWVVRGQGAGLAVDVGSGDGRRDPRQIYHYTTIGVSTEGLQQRHKGETCDR